MTIKEFKKSLKNGEVKFLFKKKDGSERLARGTLAESLMPKLNPVYSYTVIAIWTDEPKAKEQKFKVKVTDADIAKYGKDAIDSVIKDAIEKKFGKLPVEFRYHADDPKTLSKDTIFYYDLDKAGYRSFKFDQLIEVFN